MDPAGGGGGLPRPGGLMQAWKGGDGMAALREGVNRAAADRAAAQAAAAAAAAAARAAAKRRAQGGLAAELAGAGGPPPLPFQIKEVLGILRDADGDPRSFQELGEQLPVYDFSEGGPLRAALLTNALVSEVPGGIAYKSEHGVRSREDLLRHIKSNPAGLPSKRFKDAYRSVLEDAEKLRGAGGGLAGAWGWVCMLHGACLGACMELGHALLCAAPLQPAAAPRGPRRARQTHPARSPSSLPPAEGKVYKFWNSEIADDVYFPVDERHTVGGGVGGSGGCGLGGSRGARLAGRGPAALQRSRAPRWAPAAPRGARPLTMPGAAPYSPRWRCGPTSRRCSWRRARPRSPASWWPRWSGWGSGARSKMWTARSRCAAPAAPQPAARSSGPAATPITYLLRLQGPPAHPHPFPCSHPLPPACISSPPPFVPGGHA
jgi:hypothetical protein